MFGILAQLNVSDGGMPKHPVLCARVAKTGVAGDRQRNLKYHGGPDRAVCIYSEELYAQLREEGVNVGFGAVGENFTTRGINLQHLAVGDRLRVGECIVELTDIRIPCQNLNKWDPRLLAMIKGRSGWVARVLVEGNVKPGDAIEVLPREGKESENRRESEPEIQNRR
jgi:MOSC domain-containing protein YiiM